MDVKGIVPDKQSFLCTNFDCLLIQKLNMCLTVQKNSLPGTLSECQTVLIQIRTEILSILIWVQTVKFAKDISRCQKSLLAKKHRKELITNFFLCLLYREYSMRILFRSVNVFLGKFPSSSDFHIGLDKQKISG